MAFLREGEDGPCCYCSDQTTGILIETGSQWSPYEGLYICRRHAGDMALELVLYAINETAPEGAATGREEPD